MIAPDTVRVRLDTYVEELTQATRVEVKILDPKTTHPVAAMPLAEAGAWLRAQGFRAVACTDGFWTRVQ